MLSLKSGHKATLWNILLDLLAFSLLFYTASRTWDLLVDILGPDQAVFCLFALAALDGGLVGWAYFHMHGARGDMQRAISMLMIVVCGVGVAIAFVGDMFLRAGKRGMVAQFDENTVTTIIIALAVVIMANVIAFIAVKISDPGTALSAEQQKADDLIKQKEIEAIQTRAGKLANDLAPQGANAWESSRKAQHSADIQRQYGAKLPDANKNNVPDLVEALDSGNKNSIKEQLVKARGSMSSEEFENMVKEMLIDDARQAQRPAPNSNIPVRRVSPGQPVPEPAPNGNHAETTPKGTRWG